MWFALLALAAVLIGCGGGGGGGKKSGGGTTPQPTNERQAAIKATEAKCEELGKQNLPPAQFDEALKSYMASTGAYAEVGVDEESQTVWGVFKDGRIHLIANNRGPAQPENNLVARAIPSGAPAYLPGSKQARLLHSFGENFEGQEPLADMSGWLKAAGYDVLQSPEGEASVAMMRTIKNDGFFYINTHGGTATPKNGAPATFGLGTSTVVSDARDEEAANKDDLANGRLVYLTGQNGDTVLGVFPKWDTRYAVTAAFVDRYWSFARNSVVYINACFGARNDKPGYAAPFIAACHRKGAGVYLGWSRLLNYKYAYNSSRYFVDRLLGANKYKPESTPQRPFAWNEVLEDMEKHGLTFDPNTKATLLAIPNPKAATSPHLLNPSIERMLVDETQDLLVLIGSFGDVEGKAYIDNVKVDVKKWTPGRVEIDLPEDGAGSAGGVQVVVDDHRSNVRNLTEWAFNVDYRLAKEGAPGVQIDGPIRLRYRADVGSFRLHPGEAPQTRTVYLWPAKDSGASLVAKGSHSNGSTTISWSGAHTYKAGGFGEADPMLISRLAIDPATKTGKLSIMFGGTPGPSSYKETSVTDGHATSFDFVAFIAELEGEYDHLNMLDQDSLPMTMFALDVKFNPNWSLKARTFADDMGVSLRIPDATANFAPEATHSRAR